MNKVLNRTRTRFVSHTARSGREGLGRACFLCSAESPTGSGGVRPGLFGGLQRGTPQHRGGRRNTRHLLTHKDTGATPASAESICSGSVKLKRCQPFPFSLWVQTIFSLNLNMKQAHRQSQISKFQNLK